MKRTIVDEEWFRNICEHADNMSDAARKTGLHPTTFRSTAKRLGCYKPNQYNRPAYTPHAYSKEDVETLFLSNKQNIDVSRLRKLLIKHGFKAASCEVCGLSVWMDKPIPLELHHIDGDRYNNSLNNLQLLCPTCHAQMTKGSNKSKVHIHYEFTEQCVERRLLKHGIKSTISKVCACCGKIFVVKAHDADDRCYCSYACSHKASRKFDPSADTLLKLLEETPNYTQVGRKFGVSDNAVKQRCKRLGIIDQVQKFIDAERVERMNRLREK